KEFGAHVNEVSGRVKDAALRCMVENGRPVQYLPSSKDDKEEVARSIARKDKVTQGAGVRANLCGTVLGIRHPSRSDDQAIRTGATATQMFVRVSVLGSPNFRMAECTH